MTDSQLCAAIASLKRERRAVILAHNYQRDDVQAVADVTGDSLGLSLAARATEADVIVFCGVHFMAETASLLCPDKTVLMPDAQAGCPMADMVTADDVRALRQAHPGAQVVAYVNTSAAVKAEADICCTSSNALAVLRSLPNAGPVIFVPDKYLGRHVSALAGRTCILWNGFCPTHAAIDHHELARRKADHPDAVVLAHPECPPPVLALADAVLSTDGICRSARASSARTFIIATECGVLYRLRRENPDKLFYPASERAVCPNMKKTTVEKVLLALQNLRYEVRVADALRERALRPLERMLAI
jgi:quinolinate synthase